MFSVSKYISLFEIYGKRKYRSNMWKKSFKLFSFFSKPRTYLFYRDRKAEHIHSHSEFKQQFHQAIKDNIKPYHLHWFWPLYIMFKQLFFFSFFLEFVYIKIYYVNQWIKKRKSIDAEFFLPNIKEQSKLCYGVYHWYSWKM